MWFFTGCYVYILLDTNAFRGISNAFAPLRAIVLLSSALAQQCTVYFYCLYLYYVSFIGPVAGGLLGLAPEFQLSSVQNPYNIYHFFGWVLLFSMEIKCSSQRQHTLFTSRGWFILDEEGIRSHRSSAHSDIVR